MPKPVARGVVFAVGAFVLLLLADSLLFGVFHGGAAPDHRYEVMGAHAAFHAAVLVLSAAGASLGFFLPRQALPSFLVAFALGAAFGLVSVVVAAGMLMLAGIYAALAWVLLGSMGFALASRLITRPWRREKLPADGAGL
ncbi:MAG: hypothetical protein ABI357_04900 [Granulicella sp.]